MIGKSIEKKIRAYKEFKAKHELIWEEIKYLKNHQELPNSQEKIKRLEKIHRRYVRQMGPIYRMLQKLKNGESPPD